MPAAEETNPPVDTSRFRMHFTREEANRLLHYVHGIPLGRGITHRYVQENYPGWSWMELVRILEAPGLVVDRGGSPPTTVEGLRNFWFDSKDAWLVEWVDGTLLSWPPWSDR